MLELLAALAKFALYAGSLGAAGVSLARVTLGTHLGDASQQGPRLILVSAALMLLAAVLGAIVLIARLGGQIDGPTLSAIAETPAGPAIALQVAGGALLMISCRARGPWILLQLVGAVAALASFGLNGHSASLGPVSGAVALLHACAASWWLGSLLLLRKACELLPQPALASLVRRFSLIAMAAVGLLLVAGTTLILSLVDLGREEWLTPYAQALALKIILAIGIVLVAAWNKLRITPRLGAADRSGVRALSHSIGIELGLFVGVLLATAWLTTFTSPHD